MQLTRNFNLSEFKCKDGTEVPEHLIPNVQKLADNLQVVRGYLGVPITLNSGYRTPSHNKRVGGAKNSQHLLATAGDINAKGYTPNQLYAVLEKLIKEGKVHNGGLGLYPTFVHYDVREKKARW